MYLDEPRPAPRVRPWIRKLALFVLPFLVVMLGITVWDYIEMGRLTREIESIRAKGEPVNGIALVDPQYGQADNAEYKYGAAAILATSPMVYSTIGGAERGGGAAMHMYARFSSIRQWVAGAAPAPSLDGFHEVTNALTAEWQEAFSLADKGAGSPYRGVLPGGEYSYRVAGLWNMLRLLSARTIGRAAGGDGDAAVNSAISAIKLRRAIRPSQRSTFVTHEVPAMLSLSKPSEEALSRLQKTLADEEDADGPTRDFVAARAQVLDILWRQVYDVGPGKLLPRPFPWELFPSPWMRPVYTHRIVNSLRAWSELIDIAQKPWPERAALAAGPIARYSTDDRSQRLLSSGTGMAVMWFEQALRPDTLIHDRSSRTAVAIERYRRAHGEALPGALTDLVPAYLTAIPEDPITGTPLLYRSGPDAYLVYSVGPDGKDDGGSLVRKPDPTHKGPGTMFPPGADRGIRVVIRK
jgi:hypothetical protein